MKYKCYYSAWSEVRDDYHLTIDPKECLDCEDEDDLRDYIIECMWGNGSESTDYLECYDTDLSIPDKFIEEWKQLKGIED